MSEERKIENLDDQNVNDPVTDYEEMDIWQEILDGLPEWLRDFLLAYGRQIAAGVVIVFAAILLITGYRAYDERQEASAATDLGLAMLEKEPAAVVKGMKKVIKEHGGTNAAEHALLLLAAAQRDVGNLPDSGKSFARAADMIGKDNVAGQSAVIGKAYVDEIQGRDQDALAGYEDAVNARQGFEKIALTDKARLLAKMGKSQEALAVYEKLLDESPDNQDLDFIRYQVMKLSSAQK